MYKSQWAIHMDINPWYDHDELENILKELIANYSGPSKLKLWLFKFYLRLVVGTQLLKFD